jgi:hypothetical protein
VAPDYPIGITPYELREENGEPHFGQDNETFWVEMPIASRPQWIVRATFFVGSTGMQLIALEIKPRNSLPWPPLALGVEIIRSVKIDDLYEFAVKSYSAAGHVGIWFDADLSEFHGRRRPGRRGRPNLFYAEVAARYVYLLSKGSKPTKRLAEEMCISSSAARDLLNEARQRGLITRPPVKGRPGGGLTDMAEELLRERNGDSEETR